MICAFTRPRYQVSVYRTIGPLVYFLFTDFFRNKLGSEDEIKIKIKFIWTIFQLIYIEGNTKLCF